MKAFLNYVLVITLVITLPITQAYAVIRESHSTLSDAVESHGTNLDVNISAPDVSVPSTVQIPSVDLNPVEMIIGGTDDEGIVMEQDDEDLLGVPVIAVDDTHFWTRGKIIIGTSLLLTTGLLVGLLLLLSSGGSGSGSGAGSGAGGGSGSSGGSGGGDPGLTDLLGGLPGGSLPGGLPGLDGTGSLPGGLPGLLGGDTLPGGKIPHNPEPSTFLLMGLGLLVPYLRKRFAR